MMNDAHVQFLERLRQSRTARAADLSVPSLTARSRPVVAGANFMQGDRVFDPVSGLEAEIVGGSRQNVVVQTPQR